MGAASSEVPAYPSLAAAKLAIQEKVIRITKDRVAKDAPGAYKYLTLPKLLEEVLPVLTAAELLWENWPALDEAHHPVLGYRLTHVPTGQSDAGEMGLGLKANYTPQDHGSALTYARRYALETCLGVSRSDSDGAIDTAQDVGTSGRGVRKVTKKKAEELVARAQRAGVKDKLQLACNHATGGEDVGDCSTMDNAIKAVSKLHVSQAEKLATWLGKKEAEALGGDGDAS